MTRPASTCPIRPGPGSDPKHGSLRQGLERVAQPLLRLQYALEEIAVLLDSRLDDVHRERERVEPRLPLVPPERHRYGRARPRPHRVRRRDRLALAVLI